MLFLWPCSLKNTSPRILFLVVACDPTYLFGRVASDHFLALAIPKHLPWPDLHSDRIWPYSPTCHRKHGFCVAGATISMPLRCSPLTLYMLVGKCQMAFVWQVQQFWCLWDDLPWPYTCLLGSVKWLLCGRCNNFDASEMFSPDPIHAGWEVSNGFCVAGAAILMPLRWSPLTLYMLVGKGQMAFVWQVQQFRCLWDDFPWPYTCLLGRVKWLLCGRCNNCDASEMISPDPIHACWEGSNGFCVAGATISMPLRCSPLTLYMLVGKCQMAFVWQVQQFWCLWDDLPWPYTCLLGSVKWLLCGRCNNFDASEMFSPDPIHACWEGSNGFCVAGAAILMPLRWSPLTLYMLVGKCQMAFVWQVQQFRCLWDVLPWPYTCLLGSVKWLLCGRCNNFDASEMISPDPIHACWEGSQVIDSALCGRRNSLNASEKYYVTQCLATLVTLLLFVWKVQNFDGSEKFLVYTFCLCGMQYFRHLREGHRDTARSSPWH